MRFNCCCLPALLLLGSALQAIAQQRGKSPAGTGGDPEHPLPVQGGGQGGGSGEGGGKPLRVAPEDNGGIDVPGPYYPPTLPPPNEDPSVPHAAVIPAAHVAPPKDPSRSEEKEEEEGSELGEALEDMAELIEKIVDAFDDAQPVTRSDPNDQLNIMPPATTTPPPQATGCLFANDWYYSCAHTATTSVNFSSLLSADQASCLCYNTTSGSWFYQPSSFDNYMTSCASYAATQNISAAPAVAAISGAAGLCGRVGDVRTTAVVVGSGNVTSTSTVTPTTVAPSSSISPIAPVKKGMAVKGGIEGGMVALGVGLMGFVYLV